VHTATGHPTRSIPYLVPRCLRIARDILIPSDRVHGWSVAAVAGTIAILIACFTRYAYVEKHHLAGSFFHGHLQFSFIDRGYPEIFGYGLELVACAMFAMSARVYRKKQWYAFAAILFVTFLDDAFELHETIGHAFDVGLGLSPIVGDLIGFSLTGLLSVVLWLAGARLIHEEDDWLAYLVFTAYFAVLIFFGVGVDAVHGMLERNVSQTLLSLIEDGGELLTTAIISLSAFGMWLRQKHATTAGGMPMDSTSRIRDRFR
jgi:hypothetical protein